MAISFKCSHCQATLKVGDELAGKRGKCPKCQAPVQIPAATNPTATTPAAAAAAALAASTSTSSAPSSEQGAVATRPESKSSSFAIEDLPLVPARKADSVAVAEKPAPADPKLDREQLRAKVLTSFRGEVPPLPASGMERLKLFFLALVMLVLPVGYWLTIGLIAGGLIWHLIANTDLMNDSALVYYGPAVIGGIALVFLLKPVLVSPPRPASLRVATKQNESLLFEFIGQVCKQVHSPPPGKIEFDCSMQASVTRRSGELQFAVGLPLLGCMSLEQFAGIVAREFGRHSRSAGGRSTGLCCTIHDWLVRVVFENDRIDLWLKRITRKPIGYIFIPVRGCVEVTRRVLWPVMYVAHILASDLVRRREVNADRYEARVVGSEKFPRILQLQGVLEFIWQGAQSDLEFQHGERRLVDNLPRLIMNNLGELPEEVHAALAGSVPPRKTNPYSGRLTDQERLEVVRQENAPAMFQSELPAHAVLSDFDGLARDLTWDYYLATFGPPLVRRDLKPVGGRR